MPRPPPLLETEFIQQIRNFAELRERLKKLGLTQDIHLLDQYAEHVAVCWFRLAEEHLVEARSAAANNLSRSALSRSYYAAYNASKAVRYISKGWVSLKGDDHQSAPDLPSDFQDVARWAAVITNLYEHRLRADYDNWVGTSATITLRPSDAADAAKSFIDVARAYLGAKHGIAL